MSMAADFGIEVLAFAPHPDDAELFCGGFLLRMKDLGYSTGIVDLSQGELSSQGDLATRQVETSRASAILELKLRRNLCFPDGGISAEAELPNGRTQLQEVVRTIREFRPETILAPYWEDRHPDHVAAAELIGKAVFFSGVVRFDPGTRHKPFSTRQIFYYQMRYAFRPSFLVDISAVAEQKMAAISCYQSQVVRGNIEEAEGVSTLLSSPLSLPSIEAKDRYYGAMIGRERAEPYLMRSAVPLSDPIRHFREQAVAPSLIFPEVQ